MPGSDTTPSMIVRGCLDTCSPPKGTNYVIDCCTTDFCNKALSLSAHGAKADEPTLPTLAPLDTTTKAAASTLTISLSLILPLVLLVLFF